MANNIHNGSTKKSGRVQFSKTAKDGAASRVQKHSELTEKEKSERRKAAALATFAAAYKSHHKTA